jgi:GH25 family lysozyme M1 (1,4-beta-N-acetylmuramidase)
MPRLSVRMRSALLARCLEVSTVSQTGSVYRNRRSSRRPLAAAGGLLAVLAVLVAAPAPADAAVPAASTITHPGRDWMGSTVAAHEGRTAADAPVTLTPNVTQTPGFDVSHWQGSINWASQYSKGARFVYIKATESTDYRDPNFNANYTGSYNAGFIRGAYHFATPNTSTAKAQADYFVSHGGGWSKDGKTLPPMLDIEYNPYGATCYGKSKADMRTWISNFLDEVHTKTGRWATIYTTTDWWTTCTGNTAAYSTKDPLFIARYNSTVGTLPAGWGFYTFWQFADSGTFPGDQDRFNGSLTGLKNLANNT